MTIADLIPQDKAIRGLLFPLAIILAGSAGVGIGLLVAQNMAQAAAGKQDHLWIEQLPASELAGAVSTSTPVADTPKQAQSTQAAAAAASIPVSMSGEVIASKTGTVYYLPTCSGVSRILPVNRVTYSSRTAAEAKGLKPAKNCKGL